MRPAIGLKQFMCRLAFAWIYLIAELWIKKKRNEPAGPLDYV